MTDLRKKFNKLKKLLKKDDYRMNFNNNLLNESYDIVNGFLKNRLIRNKMILEFYSNECTGYSEAELKEFLFKDKKKVEVRNLKCAIIEAVKYKMICELDM